MLEIKNLSKLYISKKKKRVLALDDISFTLPDKGLVFIIGKSGSGKSTLLNLISGLDSITNGDIIADGNSLAKMSRRGFEKYMSSYIGFIFQDYHLLDEFTVYQNVQLAQDISNTKNNPIEVLNMVGLEDMAKRYPRELSGGQKQRVAIARALVKNPHVILADEPTGNLDIKSTKQVLDILKEISKERLVIIVSHNLKDADLYADRIIELREGKIISDRSRLADYSNEFRITDGILYLPDKKDLTAEEINELLAKKSKIKSICQLGSGFVETPTLSVKNEKMRFKSKSISLKNFLKLFKIFEFTGFLGKFINIFICALLLSIMYVFIAFNNFNANQSQAIDAIKDQEAAIRIQKGSYVEGSNIVQTAITYPVSNADIEGFRSSYSGEVYNLYNHTFTISKTQLDYGGFGLLDNLFEKVYVAESLGVLSTNERFLIEKFGVNGNIKYEALSNEIKDYGIYITDYLADCIIRNNESYKEYNDVLGHYSYDDYLQTYINGVIYTGYKNKYSELLSFFEKSESGDWTTSYDIKKAPLYKDFVEEAVTYYAISYSFNPDYQNAIKNIECKDMLAVDKLYSTYNNVDVNLNVIGFKCDKNNSYELEDNEIYMPFSIYNKIYGTKYNDSTINTFTPHEVELFTFDSATLENKYVSKTFKIKALSTGNAIYANENTMYEIFDLDIYTYSLYFDDVNSSYEVLTYADKNMFSMVLTETYGLSLIRRAVEVFEDLVNLIIVMMFIVTIIFLIMVGKKNINNNLHEIGVLKSLGAKHKDISNLFTLQSFANGILIILESIVGMILGAYVANMVIISSFNSIFKTTIENLTLVQAYPNLMANVLVIAMVIVVISSLFNIRTLKKLKPIAVLKAKE